MTLFRAIYLSIIVHLILVILIDQSAKYIELRRPDVAEIELIETKPKGKEFKATEKDKQIVREAPAPKSQLDEESDNPARFLSAQRQRVLLETQSRLTGMTKNRDGGRRAEEKAEQARRQPPPPADPRKASPKDYDPEGLDMQKNLREYAQMMQQEEPGPSTVGESLPQDVSIGSFTALNTDRYTYYSFFARIEELIRFRWESRVKSAVDGFDRGYLLSVVGKRNWITSVEIWLTKDGRYHSAHLMRESGISKFDQAAIGAFKEAALFPNPPQEMVESDGYIHLKYNFNVSFNPSAVVYQQ